MKNSYFLLSAFGADRPGIVAAVTRVLFEQGGNLEDASMTRLGGEFSIMLVVSFAQRVGASALERSLNAAGRKLSLTFSAKPISPRQARSRTGSEAQALISVYGIDKPGIVHRVAEVLSAQGANITDLNTKVLPRSKHPLYIMFLEIQLPSRGSAQKLQTELTRLSQAMGVDISLQNVEPVAL